MTQIQLFALSKSAQPRETGDLEGFVDVDTADTPETQPPILPNRDWREL
jgi:hypothetical protein